MDKCIRELLREQLFKISALNMRDLLRAEVYLDIFMPITVWHIIQYVYYRVIYHRICLLQTETRYG